MKNVLAITLGTRDIQIKLSALQPEFWAFIRDDKKTEVRHSTNPHLAFPVYLSQGFTDTCCFSQPRVAGEILLQYYEEVLPILHFPLIQPVVDYLKGNGKKIDYLFLLSTNQQSEYDSGLVKPKDYNNDTLHFSKLVYRYLQQSLQLDNNNIEEYEVREQVTDIDYLYTHFERKSSTFFKLNPEEIANIYLLPQGGIDQINQAFTLKLIQRFGRKVVQLQIAEGREPKELNFPSLFLNDLNIQKVLKHLEDYDFGMITDDLWHDPEVLRKANDAFLRLSLRHKETGQSYSDDEMLKDLYIAAKIAILKHKNPNEFLWRLFTINENLFKLEIERLIGNSREYYVASLGKNDFNKKWNERLLKLDSGLVAYLQKKRIALNNPNRWAFKYMYSYLTERNIIPKERVELRMRAGNKIELLAHERNNMYHNLGAISISQIDEIFKSKNYSIKTLFEDLDQVFKLDSPFGRYDAVKAEIARLLPVCT